MTCVETGYARSSTPLRSPAISCNSHLVTYRYVCYYRLKLNIKVLLVGIVQCMGLSINMHLEVTYDLSSFGSIELCVVPVAESYKDLIYHHRSMQ